jgi:hypothetical protein
METTSNQTRWLDATGWREHLAGSNYTHLLATTRLPAQNEGRLLRAMDAVEAMMEVRWKFNNARQRNEALAAEYQGSRARRQSDGAAAEPRNPRAVHPALDAVRLLLLASSRRAERSQCSSGKRQREFSAKLLQSLDEEDEDDWTEKTLRLSASFISDNQPAVRLGAGALSGHPWD